MTAPQQQGDMHHQRVLVLAANDRDGERLQTMLTESGLTAEICGSMEALCTGIPDRAAAAVIDDAALTDRGRATLRSALESQPAWSDFPLIIITGNPQLGEAGEFGSQYAGALENVAIMEHPIGTRSLVSAVKLAVRFRSRQYGQRETQHEHEHSEQSLRDTASKLGERVEEQSQTLRLLRDVATAANFAESIEEALSFALAQVCRFTGWSFGHAYLPAAGDSNVLIPTNASYEHAPGRFRALLRAKVSQRVTRGMGLVGRVYTSGQPEWTRGIERELEASEAVLAEELGIATVAAFPILAGTDTVGVLEFFSEEVADPAPELLEAMTSIGTQVGRVVERDRMDRAVRDSHRLIQKITDTAPMMIRIFDAVERQYVHVNQRMAQFLGSSAPEVMRGGLTTIPAAIHPDDVVRYFEAKTELQRPDAEAPVVWQARMRNAAGAYRWVRTWSVVFTRSEDGAPRQILSISIDVTDEVELEENLRQTERLTSIGTLAAGIAHEINNPLASVVMTAQLLRRRGFDAKTNEMLENLIQDAKRCGRIVRSVQKFARQEPSEHVSLDLNAVVRAAEELSRTDLRRSGIALSLELDDELPTVMGDKTELEQVVLNLINNAANASQKGQAVVVRTVAANGGARVSIRDDGHGMSPDVKRHIFDPFFTTRGREGGTGLGLSIAHGIVEDHGGTIEIDSEIGQGTTVTVSLPAARESLENVR
jgi:two-component system NtrC family sensor kinase